MVVGVTPLSAMNFGEWISTWVTPREDILINYNYGRTREKNKEQLKEAALRYMEWNESCESADLIKIFHKVAGYEELSNVLEKLIKYGIDVNSEYEGETALYRSVFGFSFPNAKLLLKWGANPNSVNKKGNTPLHLAAMLGLDDYIKMLIHYGAKVDNKNLSGTTALMMAALSAHNLTAVLILLKAGANPRIKDNDNRDAIDIARERNKKKLVRLMENIVYPMTLSNLCLRFIEQHSESFEPSAFAILPTDLKEKINDKIPLLIRCCASCKSFAEPEKKLKRCGGCKKVYYCGLDCQKADRDKHKLECKK